MSEPSDGRATHLASNWTIWRAFLGVILAFVVLLLVLLPPPIVPPQVFAFWPALFLFVVLLNLLGLCVTRAEYERGARLAIAGLFISLLTVFLAADQPKFGLACIRARYALRNSSEITEHKDPVATEKKLRNLIADLRHAEAEANARYVQDALKGLSGDYETMLHGIETGDETGASQAPPTLDMYTRMLDYVCTSGAP